MKFLFDFFPVVLFFIAYKIHGIYVAVAIAIAASFIQVGLYWFKHRKFENLHLISLAVVAIFGGLTLALQDEAFIKWKPYQQTQLAYAFFPFLFKGGMDVKK